ncbi:hypothetical protein E2562_017635 [Oryza meyeriana var. granulata]|uniref:DUF834 domain-containing protein n=1 Tax=Oryza meyeriana var. granulata TaxID=110450 RepID=A0A6G1BWC3_9ORYZ|nr:hypothetical protein E2562_017635 [Oryza meyeriana var. granulata]
MPDPVAAAKGKGWAAAEAVKEADPATTVPGSPESGGGGKGEGRGGSARSTAAGVEEADAARLGWTGL